MIKENIVEILIDEEKCTGCISCQLWCSYIHYKTFNPQRANLEILDKYGLSPKIKFLASCVNCGQCAQHCLYGALKLKEVNR